jgi:PAS domain S-box-containing protein
MADRARILVVDADGHALSTTARLLRAAGYQVGEAATAAEGLRLASQQKPDLILLSLETGDDAGIEVCRRIKENAELAHSLVILLSGAETALGSEEVLEARADGLIARPVTDHELLAQVQTMLRLKRAEDELKALRESEKKYRHLVEQSHDGIVLADEAGQIVEWNQAMEQITGLKSEEALGHAIWDVHFRLLLEKDETPDAYERARTMIQEFLQSGQAPWAGQPLEQQYRHPNGSHRSVEGVVFPVRASKGFAVGYICRDVTERTQAERRTLASLQEKEVLLQEIHHRVKNNLQIVSSLLDMQAMHIQDPETLQALQESQTRIKSMALVHERLYQSRDLARIDVAEYIECMVRYLFGIYGGFDAGIAPIIHVEDVSLSLDTAIPCGLLITELVSNSLRHAFPPGWDQAPEREPGRSKRAEVRVELRSLGEGRFVLAVRDNGAGLPPELVLGDARSLGLQLVDMLTHQLWGTIELDRSNGTAFIVRFTDREPKPRTPP